MTRRHREWDLVGYDSDPVPASEYDVDSVAREMKDRSDDASEMQETLRKLADLDGWRGEAAKTFADKADDVLEDLGKVEKRYSKVSSALYTWGEAVGTARSETSAAITKAETADSEMKKHPAHTGLGEPTPEEKADDDKHEAAKGDLEQARTDVRNAMDDLDDAADKAKDGIENAADEWDDGFWGDVGGWVRRHAELIDIIVTVLEVIAVIAAVAIFIAACVLTGGAPLWLLIGAAIVGGLMLAGHTALVLADTGKATWVDVGFDILNLATLGMGGAFASMAGKGLARLVATVAPRVGASTRLSALSRLANGNLTQLTNALRITNPSNNLFRWASSITRLATQEGDDAAAAVRALTNLDPSKLRILLHQDRGLASLTQALGQLRGLVGTGDEAAQLLRLQKLTGLAIGTNTLGNIVTTVKDIPGIPDSISDLVDFATRPR